MEASMLISGHVEIRLRPPLSSRLPRRRAGDRRRRFKHLTLHSHICLYFIQFIYCFFRKELRSPRVPLLFSRHSTPGDRAVPLSEHLQPSSSYRQKKKKISIPIPSRLSLGHLPFTLIVKSNFLGRCIRRT